ncbi:MAG: 16S rRNA (guanine(527)-N(7))-methyltransferase RsmG [Anaerotruncus massiliensis (ex Togo et al. 2019)]
MIDKRMLAEYAAALGLPLGEAELERFDRYAELLVEWNERMNLTAITEPGEIVVKHFVDSLTLLRAFTPPVGATLVDVGTGAGFPSVPVKIVRPDLRVTLLDSLNKRLVFLGNYRRARAGRKRLCPCARRGGGQAARTPEQYALATARAAHLRELSEYCLPLVRVGGMFAALKGGDVDMELEESRRAVELLGGKIDRIERLELPDGSRRTIVCVKKISQTSTKYPRPHAKMAKNPLA